ncbi:MAG: UPF0149 family protein [Gammaproteobacteria bacterium]
MSSPSHRDLARLLEGARALTEAPEAHGTLAGAFCAGDSFGFQEWLGEVFPEGRAGAAQQGMQELYRWTRESLAAGELQFAPLLPGDEAPVAERAQALGEFCQGFLYGLGTSALPDPEALPTQVAEIVRDIGAIVHVGVDPAESDEENEQAYAELVEFVRVGVQLLFDELAPYRNPTTGTAPDGPPASLH